MAQSGCIDRSIDHRPDMENEEEDWWLLELLIMRVRYSTTGCSRSPLSLSFFIIEGR